MGEQLANRLREAIVDVSDFPKPGIIFKDITPVLEDPELFADTIGVLHGEIQEAFSSSAYARSGAGPQPVKKPASHRKIQ